MTKKFLFSSLVLGLTLLGCAHADLTPLKGPDGTEWVAITCTRSAKPCWKAAGDFCPNGYETADEVQSTKGILLFRRTRNEMLIHCKAPKVASND